MSPELTNFASFEKYLFEIVEKLSFVKFNDKFKNNLQQKSRKN